MDQHTQYSQWTLDNGLRVLYGYRPWTRAFATSLAFNTGWCDETAQQRGLTHLVEHLAFSGKNQQLVDTLAEQGMTVNGVTEWEQTYFPVFGHRDLLTTALPFYASILKGLEFDQKALESELAVIWQEMSGYDESPADLELRRITAQILGDPSLGLPYPNNIRNLSRTPLPAIQDFARQRFSPASAVLTAVSANPPEEMKTLLSDQLGGLAGNSDFHKHASMVDVAGHNQLIAKYFRGPQVLLVVSQAYRPRNRHPLAAVAMLAELLGGGPHSVLFQKLRRDQPLSYDVGADVTVLSNALLFQCYATVDRRTARTAIEQMLDVLIQFANEGVPQATFELARSRLLHSLDLLEDDSIGLCSWLSHEAWMSDGHDLITPETYRDEVKQLAWEDFVQVVRDILKPEFRTTTLFGGIGFLLKRRVRKLLETGN